MRRFDLTTTIISAYGTDVDKERQIIHLTPKLYFIKWFISHSYKCKYIYVQVNTSIFVRSAADSFHNSCLYNNKILKLINPSFFYFDNIGIL